MEIDSPKIQKVIENMKTALDSQADGVAIAAPQIGELWRIFVVSGKVATFLKMKKENISDYLDFTKIIKKEPDAVYINPKIVKRSKETEEMEEGCLSVRWLYGQVCRAKKVVVEAYDENGKKVKSGASGLLAQIFQHEIDHLDGVLFIDKATGVEEIEPEKE